MVANVNKKNILLLLPMCFLSVNAFNFVHQVPSDTIRATCGVAKVETVLVEPELGSSADESPSEELE